GTGITKKEEVLSVKIPKQIIDNNILIVKNKGNENIQGERGNLIIHVNVIPDPYFSRDGLNIITKHKISLTKAILGYNGLEIRTLWGIRKIDIPKQSGAIFDIVIPNEGVEKGMIKGNHIAHFEVVLPDNLNERQIELLKEFDTI
ncbi:MAG: J domain-containing protein, partial [Nanopusillaceae archaeon]